LHDAIAQRVHFFGFVQILQLPGITIAQFSNTRALMKAVADDIIGEFLKNLEKLQCPVSFIKDIYRLSSS